MNERKKIPELKDEELEQVTGGTHLSSDETKALKAGQVLIIEDGGGVNLGECTFLGDIYDPGGWYYLQVHVKITKIYNPSGTFELRGDTYREGQTVWLCRSDVDFPERA